MNIGDNNLDSYERGSSENNKAILKFKRMKTITMMEVRTRDVQRNGFEDINNNNNSERTKEK